MPSINNSTPANIRLAAAKVWFKPNGSSDPIFLGQTTREGVTVKPSYNPIEKMSGESGAAPIALFSGGDTVDVELTLIEIDKFVIANAIFPVATTTNVTSSSSTNGVLRFGSEAGRVLTFGELFVYPRYYINGTPLTEDQNNLFAIYLTKAVSTAEPEILFSGQDTSDFKVTFRGMYDPTKANGSRTWAFGSGFSLS